VIHWITTAPSPHVFSSSPDAGQRGWKLHAVEGPTDATFTQLRYERSLCGVFAKHGWSLDLFIEDKCKRCERKAASAVTQ
jgi:hypothetical protein